MAHFSLCDCVSICGPTSDLLVTINNNVKLYHCKNFSFYENILFSTIYNDTVLVFNIQSNFANLIHCFKLKAINPKIKILINDCYFKVDNSGIIRQIIK